MVAFNSDLDDPKQILRNFSSSLSLPESTCRALPFGMSGHIPQAVAGEMPLSGFFGKKEALGYKRRESRQDSNLLLN